MLGSKSTIGFTILLTALAGCRYDADRPCGPELIPDPNGFCVCPEGMALDPAGPRCGRCGDSQIARAGKCECEDGAVRAPDGVACVRTGLGAACDAARACTDPGFATCHAPGGAGGYCTRTGCASAADCGQGFACEAGATPAASTCKRPPVGQGKTCRSAADCAGTEATFCEALMLKQCIVEGCAAAPDSCFPGWKCCDLARLGLPKTLCLPVSACP